MKVWLDLSAEVCDKGSGKCMQMIQYYNTAADPTASRQIQIQGKWSDKEFAKSR